MDDATGERRRAAETAAALEREIARRKLADGELRMTLESIADGFLALDRNWRFVYANGPAEWILGIRRADAIGKHYREIFPAPLGAQVELEFRLAAAGEMRDFEHFYEPWSHWFHCRCFPREGGGVSVYFTDITERKQTEQALSTYRERLQSLTMRLMQSENREHRRIAAYLHDEIGQSLAAVRVKFATWKGMKPSPQSEALLSSIEQLIDRTIEDMRTLTFELSPPILFELGLGPALEWLGENVCEKEGIDFSFRDESGGGKLDEVLASTLYRIARELLLNTVKHARARSASVSLSTEDGLFRLAVSDDGIGMELSRCEQAKRGFGGTYGLFSIREQLRYLGGSLDIEAFPAGGTRVLVAAPLSHRVSSIEGDLA